MRENLGTFPPELRTITDALPDGVALHDADAKVLYANAAFVALVGATNEAELVGRRVLELVHPDEHARVVERIREVMTSDRPTPPRVFRLLRPSGELVSVECRAVRYRSGALDAIAVVVRDLTERQRAADALARSEALFRTLIQDLRIGVLVQGAQAEILVSNRAALELLGLEEAQLLGRTSFDPDWNVVHEDGSPFAGSDHPVPTAIRTRQRVRDVVMGVYRPRRKDRVWLMVDAEPQLDRDGAVTQVVCTFSDFTERRRLQALAMTGDRLASMGRLAAGVAHEVNNPLAYVTANLDAIRELVARAAGGEAITPTDVNALGRLVEDCRHGVARVRSIVDDLRSLSRGDDESHGPVDLRQVLDAACNIAALHVRHRAQLVREIGPLPLVAGNEARLGQLFLNLLMNAVEAIPEGRAQSNEVRISTRVDETGAVVVEIRDTGAGIPADVLPRIFDPFFTTKPIGVGTGLGLAISHEIVRAVGGTIEAESEIGRGSTFRVRLLPSSGPAETPAPRCRETVTRSKILVIDDELLVAKALRSMLEPEHEVHIEIRSGAALARLRAGESFDVIICDLMMPEMTGMDLQEAIERERPELASRTVFMTGGAFTPRAQAFVETMGARILEKPFRGESVMSVLSLARRGR